MLRDHLQHAEVDLMNRTVWKFPLHSAAVTFEMPVGAAVLYVAMQDGKPTMWAEVNPLLDKVERTFIIVGTGHPVQPGASYVGSTIDGPFVWHIYEGAKPQ